MPPVPVPSLDSTSKMTNIGSGECISTNRDVVVCYNNATSGPATLALSCSCGAAIVTPSSIPIGPGGSACTTFNLANHTPGTGHTISATLTQSTPLGMALLSSDEVAVRVGAPCPIIADPIEEYAGGLARLDRNNDLSGKFDKVKGNRVILLLEDPAKLENGKVKRSQLLFADAALVNADGAQGIWKHTKIPNAEKGHHLRIVLTKDGKVISIIRAVYVK
jgi:hypothetical protein